MAPEATRRSDTVRTLPRLTIASPFSKHRSSQLAAGARPRNVPDQIVSRPDRVVSTVLSLSAFAALRSKSDLEETSAHGAKRPSSRASRPTEAKLKTNACVLRRLVAAGDQRHGIMRMSFSRRVPVAELLGHPVYEHSQARRQLPRMGVKEVDRQRRRWKAGQHFDQRAAGKLGADAISRHLNQSEAHARARTHGLWTGHRHHR